MELALQTIKAYKVSADGHHIVDNGKLIPLQKLTVLDTIWYDGNEYQVIRIEPDYFGFFYNQKFTTFSFDKPQMYKRYLTDTILTGYIEDNVFVKVDCDISKMSKSELQLKYYLMKEQMKTNKIQTILTDAYNKHNLKKVQKMQASIEEIEQQHKREYNKLQNKYNELKEIHEELKEAQKVLKEANTEFKELYKEMKRLNPPNQKPSAEAVNMPKIHFNPETMVEMKDMTLTVDMIGKTVIKTNMKKFKNGQEASIISEFIQNKRLNELQLKIQGEDNPYSKDTLKIQL